MLYSCDEPATVQLDCVVTFDTGVTSTHLLSRWSCIPGGPKVRTLELNLPDWLVYQADGIVPNSQWVLSCILLASVRHRGWEDSERSVTAQDVATLQLKPFFNRPVKQHQLCVAWDTHILQMTGRFSTRKCPVEQETVHLLSSVYASTGEGFGITKTLEPYVSQSLEYSRLKAVSYSWCTFSIWIFVIRHCHTTVCGIFYHIDSHNNYATPVVLLAKSGHLHIQINGESEESTAHLSPFIVPLNEWCQIRLVLKGKKVTVSMVCMDKEQRAAHSAEYNLRHAAVLDDTEGYFVIGGGRYVAGVEGYFGPSVFYRNRISSPDMAEVVLPDVISTLNLTGWLQTCQAFHLELTVKLSLYTLQAKQTASETCFDAFYEWRVKGTSPSLAQCGLWETTVPHHRQAAKLAKFLAFKYGGRRVSLPAVGRSLYSLSLHKLNRAGSTRVVSRILPLLLQAGCLADNRALHMSSVLYGTGLGVQKEPRKAWLLALLAAQKDDRLALLRLGHLHHRGLLDLTADPDLAYAYYANIARQTTIDRVNHTPEQTFVEAVYLNNDAVLSQQTAEDHHIFQWLKLQARRGEVDAEQAIARMLFWGRQGVSPNIQKAVKHYERGAVQWGDPASMYDYGIVLLQGKGVEKDVPKAVSFLKKAMDQGFVPAITALGWYYEQFERDYTRAVQLWEKADQLKCPEAALNLGVVHSQGLYPGKAADQFTADQYYLKSAERGHIRGAVQLADIWNTGIPGRVSRRPLDAVLWAKWTAEHNGYLGSILRKALNSYLRSDMFSSFLYYMTAAECGYAAAQFNVAYLCELNMMGFQDPDFASSCMWHFYNLTIQSQNPDLYAIIRMGDLLYEGRHDEKKDLFSAAEMYTLAALRNEPQGWYNLGLLAEEGFTLPLSVLSKLGISELYLADKHLLLSTLYRRCRDSENTDSFLPCSLALFKVSLQSFKEEYSAAIKLCTAVAVVVAPTIFFIVLGILRRLVPSVN
ncbi:uncharacterized protein V6R79_005287 [Siganus canaliculatus]